MFLVPPIARSIRRHLPPSFDLDDLISEGILGLIDAVGRLHCGSAREPEAMFRSFAKQRIRGAILDWVRKNYRDATHGQLLLEELNGQRPNSALLSPGPRDTKITRRLGRSPAIQKTLETRETVRKLTEAMAKLPVLEARILKLHYWRGWTMERIGREKNVSASTICRLHRKALNHLRQQLKPEELSLRLPDAA